MFVIISLIIACKCCVFLLRVFKNYCYDLSDNSLEKCLNVFNVCSATYIFCNWKPLTLSWQRPLSYRNQSIDLWSKWIMKGLSICNRGVSRVQQLATGKSHGKFEKDMKNQSTWKSKNNNVQTSDKGTIVLSDKDKILEADIIQNLYVVDSKQRFRSTSNGSFRFKQIQILFVNNHSQKQKLNILSSLLLRHMLLKNWMKTFVGIPSVFFLMRQLHNR